MIIHPNLFNVFLRVHNEICKEQVEQAKSYKPSEMVVKMTELIDRFMNCPKEFEPLLLKAMKKELKQFKKSIESCVK